MGVGGGGGFNFPGGGGGGGGDESNLARADLKFRGDLIFRPWLKPWFVNIPEHTLKQKI